MPTLSSSIVKHHVANMREVEEALARQVIYGGDLVTNLLELATVSEAQLTWLLADSLGIEPAPIGELPRAPESLLRLVPAELAQRHSIYPLDESDNQLLVAVSDVLPSDVEDSLSFSLGAQIVQRAAPLVRIKQALARDFALPLDRRMLRLVAKLEGRPDPSPSSMPIGMREAGAGFPKLPRPASLPPFDYPPPAAEPEASVQQSPAAVPERSPAATTEPKRELATLITPRHPAEKAEPAPREAPAWLRQSAARERGRRRHRGPYTAALAESDLLEAESRDDVIAAFFDFASQYFEYSALFVVQGDIAEGRDAHGPGTDRERVRALGFPLDLPSAFSRAKTAKSLQLVRLSPEGLDSSLAHDLGRSSTKVVLVLPVVVRGRCVLLLYGDQGESDVTLQDVGDLIAFAPLVVAGVERVIMKKKLAARSALEGSPSGSGTPIPMAQMRVRQRHKLPAIQQRVHALAKALDATGSAPPRATDSSPAPTVGATPDALQPRVSAADSLPSTASESPMAKAEPPTVARSPQAMPAPVEQPPREETRLERTAAESPRAKAEGAASSPPATAQESPQARAAAPAAGPARRNTPAQGTPIAIAVAPPKTPDTNQDQPFPLTRRTPSTRAPEGPTSGEMLAVVDHSWDSMPAVLGSPSSQRSPLAEDPKSDVGHEAPLAPSSRQLALGPRPPFRRQDASDRLLPSVIIDAGEDARQLVSRLVAGDESAIEPVVRAGEAAVSLLVAEFPGPIHPDRRRTFAEPGARASDCGPVLKALARIGRTPVAFLIVRTADRDPTVRAWATWLLGELPAPEGARSVVARFSDADSNVRRAALAAGRLMQHHPEARAALRDSLIAVAAERTQSPEARLDAVQALADLRDGGAVAGLIPLLASENAALERAVHWALCTLTRLDLGSDTKAWNDWLAEHGNEHRIEWLINALTHSRIEVRRAAGEELKNLTKEYFGYYEDLSPAERERAQQAYRDWWVRTGKARFF